VTRQLDGEEADLVAVAPEDVGERRRHDGFEAGVLQRPWRVLTARSRAEVGPRQQHDRALVLGPVEDEPRVLAPVVEQERAEAGALDPLQELFGDDLIGVDVGAVEGSGAAGDAADGLHHRSSGDARWPAIALAAAKAGLTRWVRPPAPCRPSKLRLDVDAQRSLGWRMSGFIPRHMLHPGLRHSKPASTKTRSRPSASAVCFTCLGPGTTSALRPLATFLPRS